MKQLSYIPSDLQQATDSKAINIGTLNVHELF